MTPEFKSFPLVQASHNFTGVTDLEHQNSKGNDKRRVKTSLTIIIPVI